MNNRVPITRLGKFFGDNFSTSVSSSREPSSKYFKFQKHEDPISSLMKKMKMLEQPSPLQYYTPGDQS